MNKTVKLYVGMNYAPVIEWEEGYGTVADLKNSVFKSNNKEIATINKKGIVTAKKAGKAKIQVTSSEWSGTISINVLAIKKINKKKLVKTIKVSKSSYSFPLVHTYDKNDKEVKKGYLKANKKYDILLDSVSIYEQPDNSRRYMLNYAVYDKKGKRIKNVECVEVPYEKYLVLYHVCNEIDFSMRCMKELCKSNKFEMHYQTLTSSTEELHKPTKKNIDKLNFEYGWRNTCE